ncbi:DUF5994 family protein [Streptomyces sp. Edi4]|uniref:DUF5994 family protein n=1 Tax=Streptomyces sp. Edi4 TaxID=3162527 RepID=UPI003305AABA
MTLRPPSSLLPVRLRLTSRGNGPRPIDGVWWPRSDDLTTELPRLIRALPHSWPRIAHVTANATMWSAFPGRILVANQVIQLHRASSHRTPDTICLVAPGHGRWDLLVVRTRTERTEALRLLSIADGPAAGGRTQPVPTDARTGISEPAARAVVGPVRRSP